MSEIPSRARKLVRQRSNDQCSRCGMQGTEIHHRQRRREAGHALGILVFLCGTCHRWAHSHPKDARETGFIITVHNLDPTTVPIKTFAGWMLFDNDGDATFIDGEN